MGILNYFSLFLCLSIPLSPTPFHYPCQLPHSSFHETIRQIRSRAVFLECGELENQIKAHILLSSPASRSEGWNSAVVLHSCSPFSDWQIDKSEVHKHAHASTPRETPEQIKKTGTERLLLHGTVLFVFGACQTRVSR